MTLDLRGINYKLTADTQSGVVGINAATEALKRADAAAVRTSGAFLQFGKQGELTARQMQALSYQTTDIITSLASGQSPFLVLLQQGGQLRDQFGGVGNVMRAFAASLTVGKVATLGLAAGFVGLGVAVLQGRTELDDFNRAIGLSGNAAALNKTEFDAMAKTIAQASNNTVGRAKTSLLQMAEAGQFNAETMAQVGRAALVMQKLTGGSIEDITKRFAQAGGGVTRWAAENSRAYNYLTAAQFENIRSLEAQGRVQEAARENFRLLEDTLQTRVQPAVNGLTLSLQIGARWWDAFWQAAKGSVAPETLEDRLRKANEALERRSQGGGFFFGSNSFGAAAEQQFSLSKEVFRQKEVAARLAQEATEARKGIEEASKEHQDALLRIAQAGSQLFLAQQQAGFDARAAATDRAYRQMEIGAAEFRDRMIAVERGRVDAERRDVLGQIDLERRRVIEKPADVIARDAALLSLQTKLVQVEAKRAQVNREIAEYKRAAAAPRDVIEGPQAGFRQAEIAQQAAVEAGLRERVAEGEKALRDLLAVNQGLNVSLIQDDRARGLAQIELDAEQLRRRAQLYGGTAEQRRAIDDAVAENTRLREAQLTEQLKPEWKKRYEALADEAATLRKGTDAAIGNLEQAGAAAFSTLTRGGKGAARQLVEAFNTEFARIGWDRYLARPFFNVLDQMFKAIASMGGGGYAGDFAALSPGSQSASVWAYHSGGVAGMPGTRRNVHPGVFIGAPRYHRGGLAGDEVPAILQRGERVLPRGASAGGGVTINASFYPADGQSPAAFASAVGPQLRQLKSEVISELARPGTAAYAAARR